MQNCGAARRRKQQTERSDFPFLLRDRGAVINGDRKARAVPHFKNTPLVTCRLSAGYRFQMTMKVLAIANAAR